MSLGLLAVVELVFALTGVVAGRSASPIHDTQHVGAFGAAVAAALLYAAFRPSMARGLMPVGIALGVAIPSFAVIDVVHSKLTLAGGVHHIVQIVGLILLWQVSGRPTRRHRGPRPLDTLTEPEGEAPLTSIGD